MQRVARLPMHAANSDTACSPPSPPAALQGRTYTMQHACLFELRPSPGAEPAAAGQDALQWRGFVDMPGGGNRFTARWEGRQTCAKLLCCCWLQHCRRQHRGIAATEASVCTGLGHDPTHA